MYWGVSYTILFFRNRLHWKLYFIAIYYNVNFMWKIKYYDVKISLLWSDYQCYRPILFVLVPEEDF